MTLYTVYKGLQQTILTTAAGITALTLVIFLLRYLSGILLPLTLVYIFSIILRRPYRAVQKRYQPHFGDSRFIPFLLVSVVSIFALLLAFIALGPLIKAQFYALQSSVKADASGIFNNLVNSPALNAIADYLVEGEREGLQVLFSPDTMGAIWSKALFLVTQTGGATFGGIMALITWVVIPTFVYSLVTKPVNGQMISNLFPFMEVQSQKFLSTVITRYSGRMERYFTLQVVQVAIQIVIVFILLSLFKIQGALAIAVVIGILNLVPNLGTLFLFLSTFVVGVFNYTENMLSSMLVVLFVSIVVLILDNLMLPSVIEKLSKNTSGRDCATNRTLLTVSIIFWGYVLEGILGLILAIPITLFAVTVFQSLEVAAKWQNRA